MTKNLCRVLIGILFMCTFAIAKANTVLPPGTALTSGQSRTSGNGKYALVMQADGNLVMYRTSDMKVRWHTVTAGSSGNWAVMQTDGNFVLYNSSNQPKWHSNTAGNPNSYLVVQDDGNLVIYTSANRSIWNIGADVVSTSGDPTQAGDVTGRDLSIPGMSWAGHIAMWDGGQLVEVLNEGGNVIRYNSLSNFKSRSPFWGTASANIPGITVLGCFAPTCWDYRFGYGYVNAYSARNAIIKRAYQAYLIGADYTFGANYSTARPQDGAGPARRGVYRCDNFILESLATAASVSIYNKNQFNGWPTDPTWDSRMSQYYSGMKVLTPTTFYSELKTFR
jgi:hypothetical protein